MGWDSAPPSEDELTSAAPATADWTKDAPSPEELKATSHSLSGFGENLVEDVKNTGTGVARGVASMAEHPVDTAMNMAKQLPGMVVNEGKRLGAGELLTGHPVNAVEKLGQAFYDKPLTTGLEVAPVVGAAGKMLGMGGKAAGAAEVAADATNALPPGIEPGVIPIERATGTAMPVPKQMAEAVGGEMTHSAGPAGPSLMPPESAPPAPVPPAAAPPAAGGSGLVNELQNYISPKVEAAKGAVNSQFAKQAGRPGWATNVADYLQEKSQMMASQDLGATPLQARQVGHEGMRAIGQYAIDHEIVGPTNGLRGMRAKNAELLNQAGQKLGEVRQAADQLRDPLATPVDVLQEVKSRLDAKYARGAYSGEAGQYAKALQDVEDAKPTFQGAADTATKLNKAANEAARLKQPHGPLTDVANTISEINNERIKQLVGPQKAAEYERALRDFGVNKKIQSFLERKAGGEVKRMGPGSLTSNLVQKGMDELGYRVGAKAVNKMSSAVLKNPSMSRSLPSMFKEFIHQVEDVGNEGMAEGGIVGMDDELNNFLTSKYAKKETR